LTLRLAEHSYEEAVRHHSLDSVIDMHAHVLPGIYDGPEDLEGSVAMVEAAEWAGVDVLVATPHVREDHPEVRPDELAGRVAELRDELRTRAIDVSVLTGGEVAVTTAIEMSDAELRLVTFDGNGRDLLIETPYAPLTPMFDAVLDDLSARGFRLTLAHPERNSTFQEEPERLASLVNLGVLIQVTGGSLARPRRSGARRLGLKILRRRWCHVLASDSHGLELQRPNLRETLRIAEREQAAPQAELRWMVDDAPAAILAGDELPARPAARARRLLGRRR